MSDKKDTTSARGVDREQVKDLLTEWLWTALSAIVELEIDKQAERTKSLKNKR